MLVVLVVVVVAVLAISLLSLEVASSSLAMAFRPDEGGTEFREHIQKEEADEGRADCSNNWRREQEGNWPCCSRWGRLHAGERKQRVAVAGGEVTTPTPRPASGPAERRRR